MRYSDIGTAVLVNLSVVNCHCAEGLGLHREQTSRGGRCILLNPVIILLVAKELTRGSDLVCSVHIGGCTPPGSTKRFRSKCSEEIMEVLNLKMIYYYKLFLSLQRKNVVSQFFQYQIYIY